MDGTTPATRRITPGFVVRRVSELSARDLLALGSSPGDSGFTAICVDTGGRRSMQALGPASEGVLRRVQDGLEVEDDPALASLVLAGLVEVKNSGSGWVTGPDATSIVAGDDAPPVSTGPGARLAKAAFEHVRALRIDDPATASARLYFFNRLPITPRWRERWPDRPTILAEMGVDRDGVFHGLERIGGAERSWLAWGRVGLRPSARPYKLYLSPRPADLAACLATVRSIPGGGFHAVKIGADAGSLLRPDKCVLYFPDRTSLSSLADELARRLAGMDAHGVPFTAWLDEKGLLSWGLEPSPEAAGIGWFSDRSWRIWVCNRLAVSALASRHLELDAAWAFARASLDSVGVDTSTWAPLESAP